ncbi:hypothetical protein EJB05_57393 [Eragrostis curvula]|uniref:SANTA domain-containing protein n=1 Tax=Eragrostis curvula TaxID=38414 RepID=A0A5J9SGI0_9POAL|nr:hypothetical protein EJB05_57393 [Eragrostis curvula]
MRRPRNPSTPRPGPPGDATPPFSPAFSRTAFPVAAAAATEVSEHPLVTLYEWWLESVEGDDRKIAVAGLFERNQADLEFSAPIAKRHQGCILETEKGVIVDIHGTFNIDRTMNNGFTVELCQEFLLGFPYWWENWNVRYPKVMASQTGGQPSSSRTGKSHEDSTRFYLEQFQLGKFVSSVGSIFCNAERNGEPFSSSDAEAFPDCSRLPDGTPRFEEYTQDDDIPMHENAAASNCNSERCADVCSEVENMEIVLIGASTSIERSLDGIDSNVPPAPSVERAGADNASRRNKGRQKTPVASSKRRGCMKKLQRIALNEKAVLGEAAPTLAHSNVQSSEEVRNHDGIDSNVPSAPAVEHTNYESNAVADNASPRNRGHQKTPVASSKRRVCMKKPQRTALDENAVPSEAAPALAYSNMQSSEKGDQSPLTCGWPKSLSVSTPESLKLKKTRSGRVVVPTLNTGCQSIAYAPDGSISAIIDSPPPLKGNTVKTYARKKKRTR